jgi:predicted Zn-dependent protease with MMP-like domain
VGGRSGWRRAGWGQVLWPLAVGLILCGLGLWFALTSANNDAVFRARAVPAKAVIDRLYASDNSAVPGLAQYGTVAFEAGGRTVHARVLLSVCGATCVSGFRAGQVLTVYYLPENPSYAQLSPASSPFGYWSAAFFGLLGAVFLAAAVINLVTRAGQAAPGSRPHAGERPGSKRLGSRQLISIEPGRFEDMVSTALDGLPEDLGRVMHNVAVTVEHGPGPPGLLGLYQGIPLISRTGNYAGVMPDRITIYRQAICAVCRSEQEVTEQVRRTVIHEIGHHFGIDDNRLRELGW